MPSRLCPPIPLTVKPVDRAADSGLPPEGNEVYEIRISNPDTTDSGDDSLTYALGVNITVAPEVIPPKGPVLHIERTTPIFMDLVNFLN